MHCSFNRAYNGCALSCRRTRIDYNSRCSIPDEAAMCSRANCFASPLSAPVAAAATAIAAAAAAAAV